jgi:hypothetical protein
MIQRVLGIAGLALVVATLSFGTIHAADPSTFFLQISPSPLVETLKPGRATTVELQIRNAGTGTENLKIQARSFKFSSSSGDITLDDKTVPEIAPWISYSAPTFTVQPGQLYSENVTFNVPASAGFSYSFALMVSRQSSVTAQDGSTALQGSIAVFSLINIDKPGASRTLDIVKFTTKHSWYEYLPAQLSVELKNSGNTIVLPAGNIFIQRGANDKTPLSTLPVNGTKGYVLPGTTRTFTATWNDGFPVYKTVDTADGTQKQQLVWNWGDLGKLRIGRYTAKMVAVYNDGQHDVPIMAEVSFWIIPWRLLGGALLIVLLIVAGLVSLVRPFFRRKPRASS